MNVRKSPFRGAALAFPALLASCSAVSLTGTVDGHEVGPATEAIFDVHSATSTEFGDYESVALILGGAVETCTVLDLLDSAATLGCARACQKYTDAAANLPEDEVWWLRIWLFAPAGVTMTYAQATDPAIGAFYGFLERWDTSVIQTADECERVCGQNESPIPSDYWDVTGGTLDLTTYEKKQRLVGSFTLDVGDQDTVRGSFEASYCASYVE